MGFNKATGDQVPATEFNSFLSAAGLYAASSAGSDAYAITVTPAPNDYDAGDKYVFKADVGNTGAATLNVNGLGAKTIKKFASQDLATGDIIAGQMVTVWYDGTNFQMASEARPVPFMYQSIPYRSATSGGNYSIGANSDGSVFYILDGGSVDIISRYERDTLTGMYKLTHEVSATVQLGDNGFIVQVGSYIYVFYDNGANIGCKRFLAADLTGETAMTMAASIGGATSVGWTDGTYIYWISDGSATTSRKWSISGTTFSAVTTATVDSSWFDSARVCSIWDGTNAYYLSVNVSSSWRIRKLTAIDGSSYADTNILYKSSGPDVKAGFLTLIDSTKIYIGEMIDVDSASSTAAQAIVLFPVTKP